ncbi:hypothetical protein AAFO90_16950 [Phaeobacter sp. CAU 1743]|uniref:hypothetical protein n=1 Tax=Phaeobacter sp. CAU 1743 TaxID=3140367 RepID=UPI00325B0B2A
MVDVTYPFPDEIFAAAIGEFEHSGIYVCSEFATVPRWEGDEERDRDWQRYIDADVHDSLKRYHDHIVGQRDSELQRLRAALQEIENGLPTGSSLLDGRDPLWRDAYRELQRIARLALKGGA